MPRFFVESVESEFVEITGEDARHIALSLRMKNGEHLVLCDGKGREADAVIREAFPESVVLDIIERKDSAAEPKTEVILYQALPKFDKLEYIVQKSVELGVSKIVPVLTSRCISRPDEKTMKKKLERLRKIADEAAKQSGRGKLPEVEEMLTFKNAVLKMAKAETPVFFFEHATFPLSEVMAKHSGGTIAIMVGSEGGFSDEEAAFATEHGLLSTSLGPRILRCETAPVAALSAIMYATGEMEIK
ncbi:MAG: 16S rRNA (uracil(1498)-N(3))-methyltransferase [Oscillospiraceae bacterium]|nr:16S rRNA (uracil(1498)-N(3))-methyltransferase [Oscillospiraceae bacterium]